MLSDEDFKVKTDKLIAKPSPIFDVREAKVKTPKGDIVRQYINHPEAVTIGVTRYNPNHRSFDVLLVKEFRIGAKKVCYALPAGLKEKDEDSLHAVIRETQEETGIILESDSSIEPIATTISSEGFTNEKIHIYSCAIPFNLEESNHQDLDEDELVEKVWVPFDELTEMIVNGEITSAPTIIFNLWFLNNLICI